MPKSSLIFSRSEAGNTPALESVTCSRYTPLSCLAVAIGLSLGMSSTTLHARAESTLLVQGVISESVFQQSAQTNTGPDSDGDGIRNQDDLDDDNDGILDTIEGGVDADGNGVHDASSIDTDNDGTPDVLDLDSDNDGVLDNVEARFDVAAAKALDVAPTNGAIDIGIAVGSNGLADVIETSADSGELQFLLPDSDADGTPDFRDTDSDNDGIFDLVEAGGVDNDTSGTIDGFQDADGKGVDDNVQASGLPLFDTDGNGTLDYRDVDSDGDSIPDRIEGGSSPSFPTDTDGDGAPDYRENDSDGDGISDLLEAGGSPDVPVDTDGDGIPDYQDADSSPSTGAGNGGSGGQPASGDDRPDVDADGIANQDDLDDDNDGILDTEEGVIDANGDGVADANSRDTDGDGTPDGNDLDSDNDGIPDLVEGRLDKNQVAQLDRVEVNGAIDVSVAVGSNGVADAIETGADSGSMTSSLFDTDGDGTPDYLDLDSDNDGIADLVEAGGPDADANGRVDGFADADGKGVDDTVQANALPLFDTDGDGTRDFQDADSDNDGLPDSVESPGNLAAPTDSDQDGAADFREQDSDNDGVSDVQEAGADPANPADSDGNGIFDFQENAIAVGTGSNGGDNTPAVPGSGGDGDEGAPQNDSARPDRDADGIANQDDLDDDNDGILDSEEGIVDADGNGVADASSRDTDGDGTPDGNDLDSDNDGILDLVEARLDAGTIAQLDPTSIGAINISVNVGANGVADVIETSVDSGVITAPLIDTDGDGVFDYLDIDSDGDGIGDLVEAGGVDADSDGRIDGFSDADNKGVDDAVQASALPLFDTDGDGILDYRDTDSDNDGLPDSVETSGPLGAPTDSDADGAADYREQDSDNDGIADSAEAGADLNNPVDTNGDGIYDFQETDPNASAGPDSDSDGVVDSIDLDSDNDGVLDTTEGSGDSDADGVPDYLDLDSDNDGIYDALEASRGAIVSSGRLASASSVDATGLAAGASDQIVDTDADGIPDRLDLDSDNDGLTDVLESLGVDQDLDARLDPTTDANGDGADDSLVDRALTAPDLDRDRVPNYRDLDSDQDGLSDITENFSTLADQDNDGRIDNFVSNDADGLDDNYAAELAQLRDTDGDGMPNSLDLDSDNDGAYDLVEAGFADANDDGINDGITDTDGDGIPDVNDANVTGGADADNDGIDDAMDINYAGGTDSDGDGIVDSADPDGNGDGFVGPLDDGSGQVQGQTIVLPDVNNDGLPDVADHLTGRSETIETGLSGTGVGCSVSSYAALVTEQRKDPLFGILFAGSILLLLLRRLGFSKKNTKPNI